MTEVKGATDFTDFGTDFSKNRWLFMSEGDGRAESTLIDDAVLAGMAEAKINFEIAQMIQRAGRPNSP